MEGGLRVGSGSVIAVWVHRGLPLLRDVERSSLLAVFGAHEGLGKTALLGHEYSTGHLCEHA